MNDIEMLESKADSFTVRIQGETFRNLERFARFLEAHKVTGGKGPFKDSLGLEDCVMLAGIGFTGEDARRESETFVFGIDFEGGEEEAGAVKADLDRLPFEGFRGGALA